MIIKKSIIILLTGLFLSACGVVKRGVIPWENQPVSAAPKPVTASTPAIFVDDTDSKTEKEVKESLGLAFNDWKGVPYLFGGSGYSGIDCSAFMQVVFEDYFSIMLPRTTVEQLDVGKEVARTNTKTGDMVFFKTDAATFHVGVMVDDEQFLHASTSSGVIISTLFDRYWQEKYLTTRRVMD
ncbi:MAG: NlpC/P60 family protein [Balneolaceae bacterium]